MRDGFTIEWRSGQLDLLTLNTSTSTCTSFKNPRTQDILDRRQRPPAIPVRVFSSSTRLLPFRSSRYPGARSDKALRIPTGDTVWIAGGMDAHIEYTVTIVETLQQTFSDLVPAVRLLAS